MDQDLMTDEEKQQAIENAQVAPPADIQPPQQVPQSAIPTPDKNEIIKAYLQANNDSGIKDAQSHAEDLNKYADVGHGIETMLRANSMAHGGAGVDNNFWQGMKQEGQEGVKKAQNQHQMALNSFLQQHEINRQVAQDMMVKGNYDQQQKASQYANDLQDPNSRTSKNSQDAFKSIFKDQPGISDMDVSKFSAADLTSASKNADVVAKLNEIKATKQMQLAYQNANLKDKKDQKQDQVYTDMSNKLTNPRGNTAVQQAQVGVMSGKKAMDLINQYPDLNKMPAQQVSLLAQEISKVASGGVGSEHGQRSLEANTVQSNWNKFVSSLSGEPTGADLKGFIEQNKTYLQNMIKTNNDTIKDYHQQVYNGYKKRLTPEQDALFRADHPDLFQTEMGQDSGPNVPGQNKGQGGQQKVLPAYQHPDSGQAKDWAESHPNDPRAKEILKRLGTMNAGL